MAVSAQVTAEQFAGLPEVLQAEYTKSEDGESYTLDVNPGESGLTLANVSKLQRALESERKAAREAQSRLSAFQDIDAESAREALEFKKRFDDGELTDEAKARLESAEKALSDKYEAQRASIEKSAAEKLQAANERETQLMSALESARIDSSISSALSKHGGNGDLLSPVIRSRVKLAEENGKFTEQVIDADGRPMFSRKSGSGTELMSVDEFVEIMKTDQRYAVAFSGSGSSGGGTTSNRGGSGGNSARDVVLSAGDSKNAAAYRAAREQAEKQGGRVVIQD